MPQLAGQAFNIGGGPTRSLSLLELLDRIERLTGRPARLRFEPWRTADQRYYVSDLRRFHERTGWEPQIGVDEGLVRLARWLAPSVKSGAPAQLAELMT